MNLPNKLTVSREIMIPIFVIVLLFNIVPAPINRYIAVIIFMAASFTDYLDGHLARKYNLVTNFGKFMDPLADKLLVSAALISMVSLGDIPAWIVIIIISREFIITGFRLIAVENGIVIAASWWGKIKTVSQMIMIIVVLSGIGGVAGHALGRILIYVAAFFTVVSGVDYIIKNIDVLKG
ncbi:MAG: CDP-diacylglycerol--glycerol-3-phosphate 3-phosphatidyltransferase [Ruminococcus sp.]|nr:CDP-diacylglycerol--glycerol-3-phosphate 3-phosphatidyltransferase [Ruminococcus sp.]MCI5598393.1 CDP-diacylglycerol--glycerol-3-phosphate 3-phosphatidyltransferase [Ruminococcus sp.]